METKSNVDGSGVGKSREPTERSLDASTCSNSVVLGCTGRPNVVRTVHATVSYRTTTVVHTLRYLLYCSQHQVSRSPPVAPSAPSAPSRPSYLSRPRYLTSFAVRSTQAGRAPQKRYLDACLAEGDAIWNVAANQRPGDPSTTWGGWMQSLLGTAVLRAHSFTASWCKCSCVAPAVLVTGVTQQTWANRLGNSPSRIIRGRSAGRARARYSRGPERIIREAASYLVRERLGRCATLGTRDAYRTLACHGRRYACIGTAEGELSSACMGRPQTRDPRPDRGLPACEYRAP
ncbi:hypothetical protein F4802DRAFT_296298 [Xylaria palmicola]|nr:hypothetical protein F4802DRAFT_296298 [Xylaria palmicola]